MLAVVPIGVMLSGGSIIDLDGSFFVQLGIFFTAFFILKGLVFGPVMKVMDERDAAIFGARREAEEMDKEVAQKKADFEGQLRQIKDEATKERDTQRAEAQKLARALTSQARAENAASLVSARTRLGHEADKARDEAKAQVPELAREIASKLLSRSVN